MKIKLTALTLAAIFAARSSIADDPVIEPPPPDQDMALAVCVVAVCAVAVGTIYVISRKCQPKYYWLMDDQQPPTYWVATATRKECQINGWKRIGGPYTHPEDAPPQHPPSTNRVDSLIGQIQTINVQQSQDGVHWDRVSEFRGDMEDFAYFPTNKVSGMFRLEISQ